MAGALSSLEASIAAAIAASGEANTAIKTAKLSAALLPAKLKEARRNAAIEAQQAKKKAAAAQGKEPPSGTIPDELQQPTIPNVQRSEIASGALGFAGQAAASLPQPGGPQPAAQGGPGTATTISAPGPTPGLLSQTTTGQVNALPQLPGNAGALVNTIGFFGRMLNPNFGTRTVTQQTIVRDKERINEEAGALANQIDLIRTGNSLDPTTLNAQIKGLERFAPPERAEVFRRAQLKRQQLESGRQQLAVEAVTRNRDLGVDNPVDQARIFAAYKSGNTVAQYKAIAQAETRSEREEARSERSLALSERREERVARSAIAYNKRAATAAALSAEKTARELADDSRAVSDEVKAKGIWGAVGMQPSADVLKPGEVLRALDQAVDSKGNLIAGQESSYHQAALSKLSNSGGRETLFAEDNYISGDSSRVVNVEQWTQDVAILEGTRRYDSKGQLIEDRGRYADADARQLAKKQEEAFKRLTDNGFDVRARVDQSTGFRTFEFNSDQSKAGTINAPQRSKILEAGQKLAAYEVQTGSVITDAFSFDNERRKRAGLPPLELQPTPPVKLVAPAPEPAPRVEPKPPVTPRTAGQTVGEFIANLPAKQVERVKGRIEEIDRLQRQSQQLAIDFVKGLLEGKRPQARR